MHSVTTRGVGVCGLHAGFGQLAAQRDMFEEGAQKLAAVIFGPSLKALLVKGVSKQHVETIGFDVLA